MNSEELNSYDFLINEEDEVMLLLYEQNGEPQEAHLDLKPGSKDAILFRNENSSIPLLDIPDDVKDSLQDADKILVCELSPTDNEQEDHIVYAYEAEVNL